MNIKGTKSVGTKRTLYTGACELQMVGVNPTLEQLKGWGYPFKNEVLYQTQVDGKDMFYIDIYFKIDEEVCGENESYVSHRFRLRDEERPQSKSTQKYEYINERGMSMWYLEDSVPSEFGEYRRARIGEGELYSFLFSLFGMNSRNVENSIVFKDKDSVFRGDVSEVEEIISKHPEARVRGMVGIHNGYQKLFNKFVSAAYTPTPNDFFDKAVRGIARDGSQTQYGFKADFNGLTPSVYSPKVTASSPEVQETDSDDLPF